MWDLSDSTAPATPASTILDPVDSTAASGDESLSDMDRGEAVPSSAVDEIAASRMDSEASNLQLSPARLWMGKQETQFHIRTVNYDGSIGEGTPHSKRKAKRPRMGASNYDTTKEAADSETGSAEGLQDQKGVDTAASPSKWEEENPPRRKKCPRLVNSPTRTARPTAYSVKSVNSCKSDLPSNSVRVECTQDQVSSVKAHDEIAYDGDRGSCHIRLSQQRRRAERTMSTIEKHSTMQRISKEDATAKSIPVDSEARQFRQVGITGKEEFKEMFAKLRRLKWRWGPPIHMLTTDCYVMKPGANAKTAMLGRDKFIPGEEVMQYVKGVLQSNEFEELHHATARQPQECMSEHHSEQERHGSHHIGQVPMTSPIVEQDPNQELQELNRALGALSSSNVPRAMKQRMKEFRVVFDFIYNSVKKRKGGSIYLCGCPGTGKSQTVTNVKNDLLECVKGDMTTPEFHVFTGTSFANTRTMYNTLWRTVVGGKGPPSNIEKTLDDRLKLATSASSMVVVILDEIDHLMSNNPSALRKLFEWAYAPKSRLVLVGVGNFLNFDVGPLRPKMKMERVSFSAYTPDDLVQILAERVATIVEPAAINLCAKKVASTHGDARRAITACREAINIAKEDIETVPYSAVPTKEQKSNSRPLVKIGHMAKALKIGLSSRFEVIIAELSVQAQIVLCVAASLLALDRTERVDQSDIKSGSCVKLTQGSLYNKCIGVWKKMRTGVGLSHVEFSGTIDTLVAQGLLQVRGKQTAGGRLRQLILQIEWHDVATTLGDQPFFKVAIDR